LEIPPCQDDAAPAAAARSTQVFPKRERGKSQRHGKHHYEKHFNHANKVSYKYANCNNYVTELLRNCYEIFWQ
jgi:hypothetical protein